MKKISILSVFIISLFVLYSCGQTNTVTPDGVKNVPTNNQVIPQANNTETTSPTNIDTKVGSNKIEITADGFSPNIITINAGDRVDFVNLDSAPHWPASGKHPIHTDYPGSGIEKCGTAEQPNIFDACKGLAQGEVFSFVFKEKGTWGYHDHLDASKYGKVIVK